MLNWCSYCQRFLGESAPYGDLSITHGICPRCESRLMDISDDDIAQAHTLRKLQKRLWDAGRSNDRSAAERALEDGFSAGIRGVDLLIGLLTPTLYQVGAQWERSMMSVAEEHRFTAFCNEMYTLVAATTAGATETGPEEFLLMNARGNAHTLAIRILSLLLTSEGRRARVVSMPVDSEALAALTGGNHLKAILVSVALSEQCASVVDLAEQIRCLPGRRPKLIVGGYAAKTGQIAPVPGAELIADIGALSLILDK